METVEKAKIEGLGLIEKAKSQDESESLLERSKHEIESDKIKQIIELLSKEEGKKYLELQKIINLSKIKQSWYINSDSKIDIIQ